MMKMNGRGIGCEGSEKRAHVCACMCVCVCIRERKGNQRYAVHMYLSKFSIAVQRAV